MSLRLGAPQPLAAAHLLEAIYCPQVFSSFDVFDHLPNLVEYQLILNFLEVARKA